MKKYRKKIKETSKTVNKPAWTDKAASDKLQHIWSIIIITVISIAIYSNTLQNGFVYDDESTIVNNAMIRNISNLSALFSRGYFDSSGEMSYRPIVTFSYFIDYALYGSAPWGYHLTNVVLHAINGVVLYLFLWLLLRPSVFTFQPLMISLFFAVHPVVTEAVNAISFREDLLAFLFYFAALAIYLRIGTDDNSKRIGLYLISGLLYFLSLLSKEMAVTFPLVVLCHQWILRREDKGRLSVIFNTYNVGYLAVTLLYLFLRFYLFHNPAEETINAWSVTERLLTVPWLVIRYIGMMFYPFSLAADYVVKPVTTVTSPLFILPMSGLMAYAVLIHILRQKNKSLTFGMSFFLIALLPVYNLIPIVNPIAERYLYMASIGLIIAIGAVFDNAIFEKDSSWRRYLYLPIGVVLLIFCFTVVNRNGVWKDDYALWADTVKKMPESFRAHSNLGMVLSNEKKIDEAIEEYRIAVQLRPDDHESHINLGNALSNKGLLYEAKNEYIIALKLKPNDAAAHINLGSIYSSLGQLDDAINEYLAAIRLEYQNAVVHNNLGNAYARQGKMIDAVKEYSVAIGIEPTYADAHCNLGNALAAQGRFDEAIRVLLTALRLDPRNAITHNNLGNVYANQGRLDKAILEFEAALQLNPNLASAHQALALLRNAKPGY